MHKIIGLVAVVLLLGFTTFALAKSENSNSGKGNGQSNSQSQGNQGQGSQNPNKEKNKDETASPDPSASVSASATPASSPSVTCDPNANWKNHGEYVSCVAKLKQGGQAVSEAARSDVGKKKNGTPSASLSPSPSSTASATPIATSSASPSPEATSSAVFQALEPVREAGKSVVNSLRHLIEQFQALFSL